MDRRCHPAFQFSSRLVLELDPGDAHRVPLLHPARLQSRVDAETIQLCLETREPAFRFEVRALDKPLDSITAHDETPRQLFNPQLGIAGDRELDRAHWS